MPYFENPKTKGSGIACAIPQKGRCPFGCKGCFYQSGRGYLEPLEERTPNMPPVVPGQVVRVNDGNDSSNDIHRVIEDTARYPDRFFNTSFRHRLADFPGPVVLTLNPGDMTDRDFWRVEDVDPLMFVRFRVNTWNLKLAESAVEWYSAREVTTVLTFMAYETLDEIPEEDRWAYGLRKRTLNTYFAITAGAWEHVMEYFRRNKWVHACGFHEDVSTECRHCGNCLREYHAWKEKHR